MPFCCETLFVIYKAPHEPDSNQKEITSKIIPCLIHVWIMEGHYQMALDFGSPLLAGLASAAAVPLTLQIQACGRQKKHQRI